MKTIGTLSENSLHAAIKLYLTQPGDLVEHSVGSYVVDIVRGETLIEIQIKNLYALRRKLDFLLENHPVHIVHPVSQTKWIVRLQRQESNPKRRKSPRKGTVYHVFDQLVYLADYLAHPNLTIDLLMIEQEDILLNDGKGSWRRKGWSLMDQRLLQVNVHQSFNGLQSYAQLLPDELIYPFQTSSLAAALKIPVPLARKIAYTLTKTGFLERTGKKGNAYLYNRQA